MTSYTMRAKVWLYSGNAAWHFVTLPKRHVTSIQSTQWGIRTRGFGSIRVRVTIGNTSWLTSIFPDKSSGSYVLPIKASVRKAEGIEAGDTIKFTLEIRQ